MRFERITTTPGVMRGQPCIRGMRITASLVAGMVSAGRTPAEILQAYPYLEAEDIEQAVAFDAQFRAWLATEKEYELQRSQPQPKAGGRV